MRLSNSQWNKIQSMKYVLTVIVLYIHATNYTIYNLTTSNAGKVLEFVEIYVQHINAAVVPMFMFLSGYLCYYSMENNSVLLKLKGRVKRLFIPYVFWSSLAWLFVFILKRLPVIGTHISFDIGEGFKGAILGILVYCSAGSHLWYLRNLIVMVVLMPIPYLILKRCDKRVRLVLSGAIVIVLAGIQNADPFGVGTRLFDRGVYFALGAIIGGFYPNILWNYKKSLKKYSLVFPMVWLLWCLQNNVVYPIDIIRDLLGIISIWILYDIFYKENESRYWVYETSFFVYCAHYLILESVEKVVLLLFGNTVFGAAIDYFFVPIIVLIFLLVIARLLSKNAVGIWKFINGK